MTGYVLISYSDISKALLHYINPHYNDVTVASRKQPQISGVKYFNLDLTADDSLDELFSSINLDNLVIINSIGILHQKNNYPEKTVLHYQRDWFCENMNINCQSHIAVLKALTKNMTVRSRVKYIALSARVGSISDNQLGGWLSYRVSKAALNMVIKTVSIEWKVKYPLSMIVGYHPGTVKTRLSQPFLSSDNTAFTTEQAAQYLYNFILFSNAEHSGNVYDWRQKVILF